MAKTLVSDVIKPALWVPYFRQMATDKTALFQSNILDTNDSDLNDRVQGKGGSIINMPYWNPLSGTSEGLSDSGSLTVKNITGAQDKAVKHFRGDARSVNHLAKYLSGDDPGQAIADDLARWWAEDMQAQRLMPSLKGIFATALSASHVLDISVETSTTDAANLIGSDALIDAVHLLGDHWFTIEAIAMHSVPFKRLQKQDLIEFEPVSEQGLEIPRFLGRRVIVDDNLPVVNGTTSGKKYTSYLFQSGSVAFAEEAIDNDEAFETDRDVLASDTIIVTRRHFVLHPRGVAFTGSPAAQDPTNTELETGSNWTKKYDDKNIRIVKLVTNG